MRCIICQQPFVNEMSLAELFSFQNIPPMTLCRRCEAQFERIDESAHCQGCGKVWTKEGLCHDCRVWQQAYPDVTVRHTALFRYDKAMHDWFQQFKFKGDYQQRVAFSRAIFCAISVMPIDVIVPIPLDKKRLEERGFNQVTALLNGAQLAYQEALLKPVPMTSQATRNRVERLASRQPFQLKKSAKKLLKQQRVLVVDDIYTTGRTLFYAREILAQAQPRSLSTFTLAR